MEAKLKCNNLFSPVPGIIISKILNTKQMCNFVAQNEDKKMAGKKQMPLGAFFVPPPTQKKHASLNPIEIRIFHVVQHIGGSIYR